MAFRVANRKGVIVRAASSLGSDKTGELPCGALCTVTERVTLDDSKKPRAKITADGGVVGWVTLLPKFLVPADAEPPPPPVRREAPARPSSEPPPEAALARARAYVDRRRGGAARGARAPEAFRADPEALAIARRCAGADDGLLVGELYFRGGDAPRAAEAFARAAADARRGADVRRAALLGLAASKQRAAEAGAALPPAVADAAASAFARACRLHAFDGRELSCASRSSAEKTALVLLHGMGGWGGEMLQIGEEIAAAWRPCRVVAPQALFSGSWRDDNSDRCDPFRWDSVARSLEQINRVFDDLLASGATEIVVGGFSQGTLIATLAALTSRRADAVSGLLVLGGGVGGGRVAALAEVIGIRRRDLRVFVGHGAQDGTLPASMARETAAELERICGRPPRLAIYPSLGHSISREMIADVAAFLGAG